MKTLILAGSPRKKGDTAALLAELRQHLPGEIVEVSAYRANIKPCIDCRGCYHHSGCIIRDEMDLVYDDSYDNIVIASPVYMGTLTGPMVSLASRFQSHYVAERFQQGLRLCQKPKQGLLILTGGGDGGYKGALSMASWIFRYTNADFQQEHLITSMDTDRLPAARDTAALERVRQEALRLQNHYRQAMGGQACKSES